jgi:hypothetical protein
VFGHLAFDAARCQRFLKPLAHDQLLVVVFDLRAALFAV